MRAASDILSNYQHVIEDFRLVMGSKGVFDVRVDGELIFSKKELGRHAEPDEVLDRFTEFVGSEVPRYGT